MRTIGETIGAIHEYEVDPGTVRWTELNEEMARTPTRFPGLDDG
jgi:hypothetical protein